MFGISIANAARSAAATDHVNEPAFISESSAVNRPANR
jgi:hypothetical protein